MQTKDVYGGTFLYHLGEGEPLIVVGAVVSVLSYSLLVVIPWQDFVVGLIVFSVSNLCIGRKCRM